MVTYNVRIIRGVADMRKPPPLEGEASWKRSDPGAAQEVVEGADLHYKDSPQPRGGKVTGLDEAAHGLDAHAERLRGLGQPQADGWHQ